MDIANLFLCEKIARFSCEVMTSLWFRQLVLAFVCDNFCIIRRGICLTLTSITIVAATEHRMTIENLIFDCTVQTVFSENKTLQKNSIFRGKMFAPSIKKTFESN